MITGIGTHINVKDFEESAKFYKNLGFKKVFEYGPTKKAKEDYNGMIFEHAGGKLEIADGHRAVKGEIFKEKIQSSKMSLMIAVDSIVEIIHRCKLHKIPLAVGPRHYYWGTLEVVVKDPDGVVVVFVAPYSKKEAKKVNADESFATKPK